MFSSPTSNYFVHISKVTVCSLETLYPLKFWCVSLVKTVLSIFWCFPDTFCGLHPSGSDAANRDASQSEKFMTSWWEVKQRLLQQRKTNATFGRTKGGQLAYLNRFSFDEEETKKLFLLMYQCCQLCLLTILRNWKCLHFLRDMHKNCVQFGIRSMNNFLYC